MKNLPCPGLIILITFSLLPLAAAKADQPNDWQDAPALETTRADVRYIGLATINRKAPPRTAGLAMQMNQDKNGVSLKSGLWVTAGSASVTYTRQYPWNPIGPQWDLGAIRTLSGESLSVKSQAADWARNTLPLAAPNSDSALTVTLSRLTPAVLLETGDKGLAIDIPTDSLQLAVSDGNTVQTRTLENEPLNIAGQDKGWLLLFWSEPCLIEWPEEIKYHLTNRARSPLVNEKRFRTPLLVIFSRPQLTIRKENGLQFQFDEPDTKMAMMPLYGPKKLDPDQPIGDWADSIPAEIISRCDYWAKQMSTLPVTARETYSYDADADKVTVTQKVEFTELRPDSVKNSPVPPMAALAKVSGLPIAFDTEPSDAGYKTAYGPYWLVEGRDEIRWTIQGLAKYVNTPPVLGPSTEQSKPLEAELKAELDKLLAEDYLAPWIYETRRFGPMGNVYWRMPSETVYFLGQLLPVLDQTYQNKVKDYLRQYCGRFPLLETVSLDTLEGPRRERYNPGKDPFYVNNGAPDEIKFAVVRGLAEYSAAVDEKLTDSQWQKVTNLLTDSLVGSEWATGGWCLDKSPEPIPPGKRIMATDLDLPTKICNRHIGNLVGMIRLAGICGKQDAPETQLAWGRLAREFAYRLALAKYPYWLYPPDGPQPFTANWNAHSGANAVRFMDQFQVNCWDHTQDWRWSVYVAYLDMPAEVGSFLHDYAKSEAVAFLEAVDRGWPQWWLANMTSELGNDSSAGLVQPMNTYALYMANAWIKGEDGARLAERADVSWTARGDLFYMHKLAEAIKALREDAKQAY